jgi:cytochrome c553
MEKLGKLATEAEVAQAAAYFSSIKPRSFVRVVEADTIPAVEEVSWIYKKVDGPPVALGRRIIETPEDFELFEKRDPSALFVAYVPKGSVGQGKTLVESWGVDKALACAACHGEGLHGLNDVPSLAGKSPTYIVRQLYNFKTGARKGANSVLMTPIVQSMRTDDMIAMAAYLGTLAP